MSAAARPEGARPVTGAPCARPTSGQDLGDGVWPVLAALLPRTAAIQVIASCLAARLSRQVDFYLSLRALAGFDKWMNRSDIC
jgi:hypothetical protein